MTGPSGDLRSAPDNSNLQGKFKKVGVFGSSSYQGLRTKDRKKKKSLFTVFLLSCFYSYSVYFNQINYRRNVKQNKAKQSKAKQQEIGPFTANFVGFKRNNVGLLLQSTWTSCD